MATIVNARSLAFECLQAQGHHGIGVQHVVTNITFFREEVRQFMSTRFYLILVSGYDKISKRLHIGRIADYLKRALPDWFAVTALP